MEFMRIRVLMDTSKPLRRVACFLDAKGRKVTGVLKHERLLIFCYICGLVGHGSQKCPRATIHVDPSNYQLVGGLGFS